MFSLSVGHAFSRFRDLPVLQCVFNDDVSVGLRTIEEMAWDLCSAVAAYIDVFGHAFSVARKVDCKCALSTGFSWA